MESLLCAVIAGCDGIPNRDGCDFDCGAIVVGHPGIGAILNGWRFPITPKTMDGSRAFDTIARDVIP